ncbi:MCE family protein [Pseudonocardia spinosispora]|uniref:MCE family protein n=1 Tax=Pseudonocardia spinosispora TaxID=103441 RepID=UPI0004113037|nr:MCE family protein [Pseudonocardia spinosispora]
MIRTFAVLLGTCVLLAGCGYRGATSLPLPGAIGGEGTYEVTVLFDDVTNLVPKETCRAGQVTVGSVTSISLAPDLHARVVCSISDSVVLPANSVASLDQTSLLGERFVALGPPRGSAPAGRLARSAVIPANLSRTTPDTEAVLGSLSMVLNGGNLGAIETVNTELNRALTGHEGDVRSVLEQLTVLTGHLDQHRGDITRALDSLDTLSATAAARHQVVGQALDSIPDGLRVLDDQRGRLVHLVDRLTDLSHTAGPVLDAGTDDIVANLRALDPVLSQLARNGRRIAPATELLSFPFGRTGLAAIKGDYIGAYLTLHADLDTLNTAVTEESSAPLVSPTPPPALGGLLTGGHR